ncbi:unnamed protein product [Echinostoma caproni]|uniref:SAP domain-containing protein n=1 Tax=Echinostoma caproni TaxID=27848 RepID=A0A183ADP1_9TREM|nr:unnamed protein product [Echinostoma caproni]
MDSGSDDDSNAEPEARPSNGHETIHSEKRERKKVQRLSETWSQAHVEQVEQKAKVAKELNSVFETGTGTPLGDIPIIEAAFRKNKPINLKGLHTIIYGRPGAATEIRSNLRKFRGFGFTEGSEVYKKKVTQIQNRSTSELREALRILNLEVSGTRDQLTDRLLEFLLHPKAQMVKYKGKLPSKPGRGRPKGDSDGHGKRKSRGSKTGSGRTTSSEVSGDGTSRSGVDIEDENDSISDDGASSPSMRKTDADEDEDEESPKKPAKKRGRPPGKSTRPAPTPKPKRKRASAAALDSESEDEKADKSVTKTGSSASGEAESDEDMPLSALTTSKSNTAPSDAELKRSIIELLKTVNLEETSLKLVREQIFSRYPGVDLTNKKEFINTTVKEEKSQDDAVTKPERTRQSRHPICYRTLVYVTSIVSLLILSSLIYRALNLFVFPSPKLDVNQLEVKKCPACAGQSVCPAFFRGDVRLSGIYRNRLNHHIVNQPPTGLEGTMGLYELEKPIRLRRLGSPADPSLVDEAVCRRGLQQGYEDASPLARDRLQCIPHLAIWRWRPTNSESKSNNQNAPRDSVDLPLERRMVVAPVFHSNGTLSQDLSEERVWSDTVMPTAFAPATRCSSDRMFSLLQARFRERTSFGAETRWPRFDELMFLFNLAINPQSVISQAFPRKENWPFPTHLGACGRWVVEEHHGVPLNRFCGSPLWLRLRIIRNLLSLPERLERPPIAGYDHVASSRYAHPATDLTVGYSIYLTSFLLGTTYLIDPTTYEVTVGDLRQAIVVDTQTVSVAYSSATPSNYFFIVCLL